MDSGKKAGFDCFRQMLPFKNQHSRIPEEKGGSFKCDKGFVCKRKSLNMINYNQIKMPKIKIAPSILSADLSKINREIKEVEKFADLIHVDIMDGIFVPPTTVDAKFVKTI